MCLRLCPSVHFDGKEQTHPPPFYLRSGGIVQRRARRGWAGPLGFGPVCADCQTELVITSKASETTERYTNAPDEETKGSILKATEPVSEWVCCFVWHCDVCKCLSVFACSCVGIKRSGLCTDSSRFLATQTLDGCRAFFFFTSPSLPPFAGLQSLAPAPPTPSFPTCFPVFVRIFKRKCSKHNKAVYVRFWTAQCADYNKLKEFPLLRVLASPYGSTRNINLTRIMNYTGVPELRT